MMQWRTSGTALGFRRHEDLVNPCWQLDFTPEGGARPASTKAFRAKQESLLGL